MFEFRRMTLFCLEKRLLKHKMTMFYKNLGGHGPFSPLATPMVLLEICSSLQPEPRLRTN